MASEGPKAQSVSRTAGTGAGPVGKRPRSSTVHGSAGVGAAVAAVVSAVACADVGDTVVGAVVGSALVGAVVGAALAGAGAVAGSVIFVWHPATTNIETNSNNAAPHLQLFTIMPLRFMSAPSVTDYQPAL